MPPLEPDGTSLLWESLGRRFTGPHATRRRIACRRRTRSSSARLFPQDPLYATLLPAHVQELIGKVGPDTRAVEKVLREIGFSYANRIDPFDGGPHFHARTDDITLVRGTRGGRVAAAAEPPAAPGAATVALLVARERAEPPYFMAARTGVPSETLPPAGQEGDTAALALGADARDLLQVAPGDEIAYLRLDRDPQRVPDPLRRGSGG